MEPQGLPPLQLELLLSLQNYKKNQDNALQMQHMLHFLHTRCDYSLLIGRCQGWCWAIVIMPRPQFCRDRGWNHCCCCCRATLLWPLTAAVPRCCGLRLPWLLPCHSAVASGCHSCCWLLPYHAAVVSGCHGCCRATLLWSPAASAAAGCCCATLPWLRLPRLPLAAAVLWPPAAKGYCGSSCCCRAKMCYPGLCYCCHCCLATLLWPPFFLKTKAATAMATGDI